MSNVLVVKGARAPRQIRAAFGLAFGCVLVGGCSAGTERFSSTSFGSGYDGRASASSYNTPRTQNLAASPVHGDVQRASSAPVQPAAGYQLASAAPNNSGGYLQVSRVDLPPLAHQRQDAQGAAPRTKTADGYGAYNRGPLTDGSYSGPRVYTPYDQPRGEPAAPPYGTYQPYPDEPRRYDRGGDDRDPQGTPSFYRKSRGDGRAYEPKREPEERPYEPQAGRGYDNGRGPASYYPQERAPRYGVGADTEQGGLDQGGGTVVTVAPGETLYTLAIRHGVTVDMIARANGLNGNSIKPGQQLLIPRASPASYQAPNAQSKADPSGCTGKRCHIVKLGDNIGSIARSYGVQEKSILEANNLPDARGLKVGQALVIPDAPTAKEAVASAPAERGTPFYAAPKNKGTAIASAPAASDPKGQAANASGEGKSAAETQAKPSSDVKTASAEPVCDAALANPLPRTGKTFRKPVEGLVIAQFGPQRDGTVNEGVTISVPKGTPIKAAENGIVAYVGDELPGFGNLILIRHADEYVTAYAHADEILVKKCDVVKRGQVVAKAGASGDASQPQLHFEIRKNSKPVDPSPLLAS
jgi:murein DD-endopeptidase MepM/ murein hydrolase activator NlpD